MASVHLILLLVGPVYLAQAGSRYSDKVSFKRPQNIDQHKPCGIINIDHY